MTEERRQGLSEVIDRLEHMQGKLGDITETLDRQNVALFAHDPHNEFEMLGVMTIMQKVNNFVDVMCSLARAGKKILKATAWTVGAVGTLAGTIAAARAVGWLPI